MEKIKKNFLPLGVSRITHSDPDFEELQNALASCACLDFQILRLDSNVFWISIKLSSVPTARGGYMDHEDIINGMVGDKIRLTYGHYITIIGFKNSNLEIEFSEK